MKSTVTKKEFKTWLKSKKPTEIVGYSCSRRNCPLGKYFQQLNKINPEQVHIDEFCIELSNDKKSIRSSFKN